MEYIKNSTGDNSYYKVEIEEAYELNRKVEEKTFKKDLGNVKLLWHGSRITNFVGIISQGLRIAPPSAPSTGYNFGKGVYFADMASKSLGYCHPVNKTAVIMLCEVALGNMNELYTADYNAANLPKNKHSTKGCGRTHPDDKQSVFDDYCEIPSGKHIKNNDIKVIFNYMFFIKFLDVLGI